MKVSELPLSKIADFGNPLAGMKTLRQCKEFPELVLRRVASVAEAAALGGVYVETNLGFHVIACQDRKALLNSDIVGVYGSPTVQLHPKGMLANTTNSGTFGTSLTYEGVAGHDNARAQVDIADVKKWCAIVTPCNMWGWKSGMASPFGAVTLLGAPGYSSSGDVGSMPLEGAMGPTGQFLVAWRHVVLAYQLAKVLDEGSINRMIAGYPDKIKRDMGVALVSALREDMQSPVGVDIVYTSMKVQAGDPFKRTIGVDLFNGAVLAKVGTPPRPAATALIASGAWSEAVGNMEAKTSHEFTQFDLGSFVFWKDKRSLAPSNVTALRGYNLDTATKIPKYVVFGRVKINLRGCYQDVMLGRAANDILAKFTGADVNGDALPSLRDPDGKLDEANYAAGDGTIGSIQIREPLMQPTLTSVLGNALARAEAEVTGGNIVLRRGDRIFEADSTSGSSATMRRIVVQFPGSRWTGASKNGLKLETVARAGDIRITNKTVTSGGYRYIVIGLYQGDVRLAEFADCMDGAEIAKSTGTTRGVSLIGTVNHGAAATAVLSAPPGAVYEILPDGKPSVLKTIPSL